MVGEELCTCKCLDVFTALIIWVVVSTGMAIIVAVMWAIHKLIHGLDNWM